jgi:hypothetical protein
MHARKRRINVVWLEPPRNARDAPPERSCVSLSEELSSFPTEYVSTLLRLSDTLRTCAVQWPNGRNGRNVVAVLHPHCAVATPAASTV